MPAFLSPSRAAAVAVLAAALVIGTFFRVYHLSSPALLFDETLSFYIANSSPAELLARNSAYNSAPPFSIFVLKAILSFGHSEWFVRIGPSIAGILTILFVYLAGRELLPEPAAAAASLCCAVSPVHVQLSREFRVYSMSALAAAIGAWAIFRFHKRPTWARAAVVTAVFFIGLQMHYVLAPVFTCMLAAVVIAGWRTSDRGFRLQGLVITAGIAAGVVLVWFTSLRGHFYPGRAAIYTPGYVPKGGPVLKSLAIHGWEFLSYVQPSDLFLFLFVIGVLVHLRANSRDLLGWTIILITAAFMGLSALRLYPFGAVRQCLAVTIPFLLVGASALVWLADAGAKLNRWVVYSLGLFIIAAPAMVTVVKAQIKAPAPAHDIRTVLDQAETEYRSGDVLFVSPKSFPKFNYYSRRYTHPWIKGDGWEMWMRDERAWDLPKVNARYARQLQETVETHSRVWVLTSPEDPGETALPEVARRIGVSEHLTKMQSADTAELYLLSK